MKKILFLCLISLTNLVKAQSTTSLNISETPEYKDEVKTKNILTIHTSKSGETAIVRSSKKNFLFDIFDAEFSKSFTKTIKISKKEEYVGDLFYNNQLKIFTVYSPKKDERILYCHTLNLSLKSYEKTTIFKTTVEKKQSLFGSRNKHITNFALSPNNKYYAIATDNVRKNKNSYTIRVFDSKTEELVYKKAYQENEKHSYVHNDLYIDDNAVVYSLGKLFLNGKSNKKDNGEANYQFTLNKITKDDNKELLIDLKEEHIQSLKISKIKNQLHLIGFYSKLDVGRIKGGCNFIIDTDNFSIKSKRNQILPKQVYEDLYGYRKAARKNKKKKELRNFEIDYILTDANGETYLIAEEFYITQTYVQTGTVGGYTQTVYHYDDILILKINPEGNLIWGRSIFKRSVTPSYNAFLKDEKLHIILNSGKNLTEKKDGRTKVSQGWFESSSLYDFEYNTKGEVSYNKIQNNNSNTYYLPYYGSFEADKFIMMSSGNRKKTFMILE